MTTSNALQWINGATTLRGEHPKLKTNCIHPDRLDCNYGIGYERCERMKYQEGHWICVGG